MRRVASWMAGVAFGAVCVPLAIGLSPADRWLSHPLVMSDPPRQTDAIVVLGAGTYDGVTLTPDSAYRLLRGLELLRAGYAPLLILAGTSHRGTTETDADVLAAVARSLGVPDASLVVHRTPASTHAAAQSIAGLARARGITSILLTTSPLQSRRAAQAFRRAGLDVVSASSPAPPSLTVAQDDIAGRLNVVTRAVYEWAVIGVYAWRGWT